MNRDHYQNKLQEHYTKVDPRHALAHSAGSVSYFSEYRLQELQMRQIELNKRDERLPQVLVSIT